jgi:pimeloyl-ACP methyl ester carboxylesterase
MATFVLVPGAGGMAWYWHPVAPLIRAAAREAIAVDLPGDDSSRRQSARKPCSANKGLFRLFG